MTGRDETARGAGRGNLPHGLPPLPVTLVTGFLGAGKTTLVNRVLRRFPEDRIGVLVNDFGDVAIDADLVVAAEGEVLTLANGCICCSLRSDLHRQMMSLAETEERPDHLLVEASGISDPATLLETLLQLERYQIIRLDGVVAVVDAERHASLSGSARHLADRQVMAADLVVLSKLDLVDAEVAASLQTHLQSRGKRTLAAREGDYPLSSVLAPEGPRERSQESDPERAPTLRPESSGHDFRTWCFESEEPLAFKALVAALRKLPVGVHRAKGFVHAVERPGARLVVHLVGDRVQVRTIGDWGDRRPLSRIVFVGEPDALDPAALEPALAACRVQRDAK